MSSATTDRRKEQDIFQRASNDFALYQDSTANRPAGFAVPRKPVELQSDKRPQSSSNADSSKILGPIVAKDNALHSNTENFSGNRRYSLPTAFKPAKPGLSRLSTALDITKAPTRRDQQPKYAIEPPIKKESSNVPSEPDTSSARPPPFSLWDYLQIELAATDTDEAQEFKRERIKNFLILPDALERTLLFGFIVCLDSFLYIFTILPIRFVRAICNLVRRMTKSRVSLKSSEKVDVLKGGLILITCLLLNQLDASRIYHNIRGQAAIKLYVLYNVLEIGDKLFCALGQDILDCLFSKSTFGRREDGTQRHLRPLAFFFLAIIYNVSHTVLLFYQVVTLNVTVNSFSNALMTLLLSNQFVEIKGSVFKKFEKEGLFQITCADMVERFQLFIMLLIIGLRNTFEMGPTSFGEILTTTIGPMVTVLGSEVLVDWLKHAFITKFNHVRPTIYSRFTDVLCRDYVKSASAPNNTYVDQSPAISRRIGLPVLPLVCLTIRSSSQIVLMYLTKDDTETYLDVISDTTSGTSAATGAPRTILTGAASQNWEAAIVRTAWYVLTLTLVFTTLILIKLCLGISLIRFAHTRTTRMNEREEAEAQEDAERKRRGVYIGVVEVDAETKRVLNRDRDNLQGVQRTRGVGTGPGGTGTSGLFGLERYSMISKRIW